MPVTEMRPAVASASRKQVAAPHASGETCRRNWLESGSFRCSSAATAATSPASTGGLCSAAEVGAAGRPGPLIQYVLDKFSQGHCLRRTFLPQGRASNPGVHSWQKTGVHTLPGNWAEIMRPTYLHAWKLRAASP